MKIKKVLLGIAAFAFSMNVFSQGIEFEYGTFDEALAKAKAENKMVFMDCYTVWCGPCKRLANEVFPLKEVGDYFNAHFVSIKMDMEKGEGIEIRKKYGVKAFPTMLWIDAEGKVMHRLVGGRSAKALIEVAKIANDPEKNWGGMERKFKNGERSIAFLQDYILAASEVKVDTKEAAEIYYAQRKEEDLFNRKDLDILAATIHSTSDEKFTFLLKNREKFYEIISQSKLDNYISKRMMSEIAAVERSGDETAIENKRKELLAMDETLANKAFDELEMKKIMNDPDPNEFLDRFSDRALKDSYDNPRVLSMVVGIIIGRHFGLEEKNAKAENEDAKIKIKESIWEKAFKIAKRAVELEAGYLNLNCYAYLLNREGQIEEAKKMAEQALELAPEDKKKDLWVFKFINGEQ